MDRDTDRLIFGRKSLNAPRPRLDRFVAPRESFPEMQRRFVWGAWYKPQNDDFWNTKYLNRKRYTNYLNEAFGLVEPVRVMEYGRPPSPWPCIPRKQSYLFSADSILDLPSYKYAAFPDLLDWSKENILVAALGRLYHKWSWRTQNRISEGFTKHSIYCCRFDPSGKLLALGTGMKTVEIHDTALSKCESSSICPCPHSYCLIVSIDWSPTGNSLVTGCSQGTLVSRTRKGRGIQSRHTYADAAIFARVSPDARYVAASAVGENTVVLLSWPALIVVSSLDLGRRVMTLTWHPWRSALLAVGTETPDHQTHLCMWDAPSGRFSDTTVGHTPQSLDTMLFSHRTGELVLGMWVAAQANSPKAWSQLVVMSNTTTVVDQWGEGRGDLDRVRTMIFNPDGTKLATATSDEDLIIWNFLPEDCKMKKRSKRFSDLPVYLDKASHGISLR